MSVDGTDLEYTGDELVIGLVAAVGTDLDCVCEALQDSLTQVRYKTTVIKLSQLIDELQAPEFENLPQNPADVRIDKYMDAGNHLRTELGRGDAMALLAIGAIRNERELTTKDPNKTAERHAWILRSLKNPKEVETLRTIYGSSFILLGAYSPRSIRVHDLAKRIAASRQELQSINFRSHAEKLILRDESESGNKLGQNVRDTFPMADAFLDVSDKEGPREAIQRFVEIVFGYPFHTPTREEYGMFQAFGSAMRSSSLGRQVGAAIATPSGDIVAVGANEVPKAGGGLYWPGDDPDRRDFRVGHEINDLFKQTLIGDVLTRLKNQHWLVADKDGLEIKDLLQDLVEDKVMKDAQLMNIIEFMRCVHAEMASIVDAGRRGIAIGGAIMFCTTFPCHECAKHIVAAGLTKVIYIEPYAKSLVSELYPDSISVEGSPAGPNSVVFQPFVGIAPRWYLDVFPKLERKEKGTIGNAVKWDKLNARPRFPHNAFAVKSRMSHEAWEVDQLWKLLKEKGIQTVDAAKTEDSLPVEMAQANSRPSPAEWEDGSDQIEDGRSIGAKAGQKPASAEAVKSSQGVEASAKPTKANTPAKG
jgi:deoxycytidylate deaminase